MELSTICIVHRYTIENPIITRSDEQQKQWQKMQIQKCSEICAAQITTKTILKMISYGWVAFGQEPLTSSFVARTK